MKRSVLIGLIIAGLNIAGYGSFEDIGTTARSKAMGDAIFADFDAVNSMDYNPATLSMARSIQFYGAWASPYYGLNDGTYINTLDFNLVIPFWNHFTIPIDEFFTKRAALGISVHRMSLGGGDSDGSSLEFEHEGVYSLFYAKDLNDVLLKGARISVGVKLSLYDIGIGNSIDVQNNPNITRQGNLSFGMDLGVTYDFSDAIHLGLTYRNLVQPNVSILPDGTDILPSELHFGGNWDIGDLLYVLKKSKLGFGIVSYGRDPNDNRQADMSWHLGYEFRQLSAGDLFKDNDFKDEILAFRFGAIYDAKQTGEDIDILVTKLKGQLEATGGLGFTYVIAKYHKINIDYAVDYNFQEGSLSQSAGLTYEFLFPKSYFAYKDDEIKALEKQEMKQNSPTNQPEAIPATNTAANVVTPSTNMVVSPKTPKRK